MFTIDFAPWYSLRKSFMKLAGNSWSSFQKTLLTEYGAGRCHQTVVTCCLHFPSFCNYYEIVYLNLIVWGSLLHDVPGIVIFFWLCCAGVGVGVCVQMYILTPLPLCIIKTLFVWVEPMTSRLQWISLIIRFVKVLVLYLILSLKKWLET